jgi:hypothetical protein
MHFRSGLWHTPVMDKNLQKTMSISADETWHFESRRLGKKLRLRWRSDANSTTYSLAIIA